MFHKLKMSHERTNTRTGAHTLSLCLSLFCLSLSLSVWVCVCRLGIILKVSLLTLYRLCPLCPVSSPSEVHTAGKLQWHFTCGFDFSLWLQFVATFAVLKRLKYFIKWSRILFMCYFSRKLFKWDFQWKKCENTCIFV